MTRFFALGALLLSTACLEVKTEDTSLEPSNSPTTDPEDTGDTDTDDPVDTGDAPVEPVSAWVMWDSDGAILNLENVDSDAVYYFGIAQTNGNTNSADANNAYLWVAEDCFLGYTGPDGELDFAYCHEVPAAEDGYVGLELINVDGTDGVTESGNPQYTYLSDSDDGGNDMTWGYTYILDDASNEMCYVWGNEPAFYDEYWYSCEWKPEWDL